MDGPALETFSFSKFSYHKVRALLQSSLSLFEKWDKIPKSGLMKRLNEIAASVKAHSDVTQKRHLI